MKTILIMLLATATMADHMHDVEQLDITENHRKAFPFCKDITTCYTCVVANCYWGIDSFSNKINCNGETFDRTSDVKNLHDRADECMHSNKDIKCTQTPSTYMGWGSINYTITTWKMEAGSGAGKDQPIEKDFLCTWEYTLPEAEDTF